MAPRISSRFSRWLLVQVGFQGLLVLGIIVFGFLLVEDASLRWDLTDDSRFTISEASHELARGLEDPLAIRVYMSNAVPPRYEALQRQVLDILSEYEAAGDKIKIERYDPADSQTAANEAKNYRVPLVRLPPVYEATSVSVPQVYGGIVLVYRDRNSEVINFASRYREGYEGLSALEYEISSKIWQLSHARPKLGLTGYLARTPRSPMGPGRGQPQPIFNGLRRILGEAFEIVDINLDDKPLDPKDVPLLLVVRPKEFSDVATFRLDQYLMKGGRVIMFVTQGEVGASQWAPSLTWTGFRTGLDAWLASQGLRIPEEIVCHLHNANPIEVTVDVGHGLKMTQMLKSWFRPMISDPDSIDKDNPAVQTIKQIAMFWPHPVDLLHEKLAPGVQNSVLLTSHEQESWRWTNMRRIDMRQIRKEDRPSPEDIRASNLVVALEGTFQSFYAEKSRIPPSLKVKGEDEKVVDPEVFGTSSNPGQPGHLVVVGNAIFVSDAVLREGRGGQIGAGAREATLLAFNLIDWLARSKDLIALRAKKYTKRQIVDEDFDDDLKEIREKVAAGEITEDKWFAMIDDAREHQKTRRKRWRWINVAVPSFVVILAGALVWILRAAMRARATVVPHSIPPESVRTKE